MKHVVALIIKVLMVAVVLLIVMTGMYGYPAGATFGLSLIIAGLSYLVGDLGILRVSNNTVATIGDIALAAVAIWLIGPLVYGTGVPFTVAVISSVVIAVGEWFYHKFIAEGVLPDREPTPQS
ncbi:DUF2512 family protein [Bacillus sp. FJAT-44742]|uniref:DUF2512 family protein n=1 Tax=Bacillus sp. FJAT-44742 TaxID=2014005 RepID=UPI000C24707D|nr:DUF2512 family protein [Bacillus sp. FJAT-44742]